MAREFLNRLDKGCLGEASADLLPELKYKVRVRQGPMTIFLNQAKTGNKAVEVVFFLLWKQTSGEFDRAEGGGLKGVAGPCKGLLQKAIVKPGVVGHEEAALEPPPDLWGQLLKAWCLGDHVIGDAGECLNKAGNGLMGIDQARPSFNLVTIHQDHANFCDSVFGWR
ncbi:MAG: hypothetical protein RL483_1108 [Pseudomonadota bacterium]